MFYFRNFIFKLRGLKHKLSKLAFKEIQQREDMLNKSHPHIHEADIRQSEPNVRVFVFAD